VITGARIGNSHIADSHSKTAHKCNFYRWESLQNRPLESTLASDKTVEPCGCQACQHDFASVETQPWTCQHCFTHSSARGFHLNFVLLQTPFLLNDLQWETELGLTAELNCCMQLLWLRFRHWVQLGRTLVWRGSNLGSIGVEPRFSWAQVEPSVRAQCEPNFVSIEGSPCVCATRLERRSRWNHMKTPNRGLIRGLMLGLNRGWA